MLDLLTGKEQEICMQLIIGISMPMIAFLNRIRTAEVDECRRSIIRKFEQKMYEQY